MRLFSLAFFIGVLLLQNFSYLPALKWIIVLGFSLFILLMFLVANKWNEYVKVNDLTQFSNSNFKILKQTLFAKILKSQIFRMTLGITLAILLGFWWSGIYAHWQTRWTLPVDFEGKTVESTGYIASIPSTSEQFTSFLFAIKKLQIADKTYSRSGLVRLTWRAFDNTKLRVGDQWKLTIRLKKIHGTQNPGGFDFEAYALQEKIRATGYVVVNGSNKLLGSHWYHYPVHRLRERLKRQVEANLPTSATSPWITALVVGERQGISQDKWEVLRNTGTNHLMAIAGLHIGFMSGWIYFLVDKLWRISARLPLKIPAQVIASLAALFMAIFYSLLAGFSLPTQRACIMFTALLITILTDRKTLTWQTLCIALLVVLISNPLNVLTQSFWLSFGAVALIIFGVSARLASGSLWWKWGRLQWVTAVGLIPLCLWLFQQCSLVSFAANAIAIPWVGFIIVPLSLLGSFLLLLSVKIGSFILWLADKNLSLLWYILSWFAHLHGSSWYQSVPNTLTLIIALTGCVLLLAPTGFPGKFFGFIGFIPLLNFQPPVPKEGEFWLTLLDVGQGLSTVIQTQNHILVFDAGAKLNPNYDMGASVVLPFIRTLGIDKVAMLVVSHGDNDHIGGVGSLLKYLSIKEVKTSVPEKIPYHLASYCLRGQTWEWDKVNFQFLYPTPDNLGKDNDSSCVLRISNAAHHVLLTGDIEKYAEKYLVNVESEHLPATIVVAPHHGSKTSASIDFLEKIHPQFVLFPIGYRNRYHFPHISVIEKYDKLGVIRLDTSQEGAITFHIHTTVNFITYRRLYHHYWNS